MPTSPFEIVALAHDVLETLYCAARAEPTAEGLRQRFLAESSAEGLDEATAIAAYAAAERIAERRVRSLVAAVQPLTPAAMADIERDVRSAATLCMRRQELLAKAAAVKQPESAAD